MHLRAPAWWYGKPGLWPHLLAPAAVVWNTATRLRWAMAQPARADMPVVCIGNLTAGGTGKTPAALAIARLLVNAGARPVFLTRGYGGVIKAPHVVDPKGDTAREVGDEALLLARVAPTIVSADRVAGARLAADRKASVIVMDDGFQNPGLAKDLSLLVVDRATGIGNGRVIPAGPLRGALDFEFGRAHGLILVGEGSRADDVAARALRAGLPLFDASIAPNHETDWLKKKPVIAFAGIANPDKFFVTLQSLGCEPVHRVTYPDHHPYAVQDADTLLRLATRHGAQLVTTEKDMVRLEGAGSIERLRASTRALPVRLRFKDQGKVTRMLARALKRPNP